MEWIDTLLALAGIALMAVTVLVALAAIAGWAWFNRAVQNTARETAQKTANEELRKFLAESNIRGMLKEAVKEEADVLYSDMDKSPGHDAGGVIMQSKGEDK